MLVRVKLGRRLFAGGGGGGGGGGMGGGGLLFFTRLFSCPSQRKVNGREGQGCAAENNARGSSTGSPVPRGLSTQQCAHVQGPRSGSPFRAEQAVNPRQCSCIDIFGDFPATRQFRQNDGSRQEGQAQEPIFPLATGKDHVAAEISLTSPGVLKLLQTEVGRPSTTDCAISALTRSCQTTAAFSTFTAVIWWSADRGVTGRNPRVYYSFFMPIFKVGRHGYWRALPGIIPACRPIVSGTAVPKRRTSIASVFSGKPQAKRCGLTCLRFFDKSGLRALFAFFLRGEVFCLRHEKKKPSRLSSHPPRRLPSANFQRRISHH